MHYAHLTFTLHLPYSDITFTLQWHYIHITVTLHSHYSDITFSLLLQHKLNYVDYINWSTYSFLVKSQLKFLKTTFFELLFSHQSIVTDDLLFMTYVEQLCSNAPLLKRLAHQETHQHRLSFLFLPFKNNNLSETSRGNTSQNTSMLSMQLHGVDW